MRQRVFDFNLRLLVRSHIFSIPTLADVPADNGIGVAPQKQALLFRSFSQVDDSITRSVPVLKESFPQVSRIYGRLYGGSGLGLAIVRQLANLMSGDAWCVSEPGKGSSVVLLSELQATSIDSVPIAAPSSSPSRRKSLKPTNLVSQLIPRWRRMFLMAKECS